MALEEHSILIKALVTEELWPLFSGRSPEALPTGSAHEGLAPFIWCNSERSETLESEICADLLMETMSSQRLC